MALGTKEQPAFDREGFFAAYRERQEQKPHASMREIYEEMVAEMHKYKTLDDSILDVDWLEDTIKG